MVRVAQLMGARRIVTGVAIPHPVGNPNFPPDAEKEIRRSLLRQALNLLATPE